MYGLLALLDAKLILEDLETTNKDYDSDETGSEEDKNVAILQEENTGNPPYSLNAFFTLELECPAAVSMGE